MKKIFISVWAVFCLCSAGMGNDLLIPCNDFKVIGKSRYSDWQKCNFSYGEKIQFEKHIFSLPEEVDEIHCTPFKADFNADGKEDYILQVAGTGNGSNFGMCDIYIYVTCPEKAGDGLSYGHVVLGANGQKFRYMHMSSYGISAARTGKRIILKGTSLSNDRRTRLIHYYSFDANGWMKEIAVQLLKN